jgi:hypothetical protein
MLVAVPVNFFYDFDQFLLAVASILSWRFCHNDSFFQTLVDEREYVSSSDGFDGQIKDGIN